MKTSLHAHPSLDQLKNYVKYLSGETPDDVNIDELFDVEDHLVICEECSRTVKSLFDKQQRKKEMKMEAFYQEVDRKNILSRLEYKKKYEKDHDVQNFIDKVISNLDNTIYNTLTVYIDNEKKGSRMISRLSINDPESYFVFDSTTGNTRTGGLEFDVENNKKVITSNKAKYYTEICLSEETHKLSINIHNIQSNKYPKLAIIRFDKSLDSEDQIQIKKGSYNSIKKIVRYEFDNLDRGSYYLFIEPDFLI